MENILRFPQAEAAGVPPRSHTLQIATMPILPQESTYISGADFYHVRILGGILTYVHDLA
ncbi:hypothetical protein [Heyndrickxia ginsengihumi]|uniref:hypothetical protein n=1 Tax=Heyndrickxia ginsengihumi TaxID=363870 RepID=UPI0004AF5EF8